MQSFLSVVPLGNTPLRQCENRTLQIFDDVLPESFHKVNINVDQKLYLAIQSLLTSLIVHKIRFGNKYRIVVFGKCITYSFTVLFYQRHEFFC